MRHWIGTSGFQYPEWKGKFYPEDLPKAKMLGFYAERFRSTESNYTFRRVPNAKTMERWSAGTPEGFAFSPKAPQKITHFAKLRDCAETVRAFYGIVSLLGPKLGAVLFQLPPTLVCDVALLRDFLAELPKGMRAAFEFRHASWFAEPTYATLRAANAALCLAENEELATPWEVTADFGYLRPRREDYQPADLRRWSAFVGKQEKRWSDVYIYFKHEEEAVGPKFAAQMQRLRKG